MFAENNRISHRQLRRQIVLAFAAPFLLSLTGWQNLRGINGILGIAAGMAVLAVYVIFLVRLGPAYERLQKTVGRVQSGIIVFIYLVYILFTAAYLLDFVSMLASQWLLTGVSLYYIKFVILAVCVMGSHQGMQKRGRMAEVSFAVIFGALVLLILLAAVQGEHFPFSEFMKEGFQIKMTGRAFYGICCGFSGLTLLPFLLPKVEKPSSTGKSVYGAIVILSIFLGAVLLLLPVTIGWDRMMAEKNPIIPLLAGTNLPGDILARFDVIWIALLIYGLLFSLGSLFYYGSHILQGISFPVNRWILAAFAYLISCDPFEGYKISSYYGPFLGAILAPVMLVLTLYVYVWYRRKQ